MSRIVLVGIATSILAIAHSAAAQSRSAQDIRILHHEPLSSLRIAAPAGDSASGKVASQQSAMALTFQAFGREFQLELETNIRLIEGLGERMNRIRNATPYKGRIAGNEESWASITLIDGRVYGMVWDGSELYGIEPNRDIAAATPRQPAGEEHESSIYRLSDTVGDLGLDACGVVHAPSNGNASHAYLSLVEDLAEQREVARAAGATSELDLGIVADFEFFQAKGQDSEAELLARINNVDVIFSEQVGVQINAAEIVVFQQMNDPFTTSNPEFLLEELGDYAAANMTQPGLVHLYTGRDLDGGTIGIAYLDALCNNQFGVGLSEGVRTLTTDSLIAAHEIGHNFGSGHDGDAPCQLTPPTFLMAPAINGSDMFSQCSLDQILPKAAQASCITEISIADVGIALAVGNVSTFFDFTFDYDVTVSSVGQQEVQNVVADISLPSGFSVQSATADSGSCTSGAGQTSCDLGNIPSNASRAISMNVRAMEVGTFATTVSVTADNDENTGNNSETGSVVVDPAVDLAVTLSGGNSVVLNQAATVTATITNQTAIAASNLALSFDVPAGLEATGATPSAGTCDVQPASLSCQHDTLQANGSMSVEITLNATDLGEKQLQASVTGGDLETDASNNTAQANLTVVEPPADGGGGGSWGLLWLALLWATRRLARVCRF